VGQFGVASNRDVVEQVVVETSDGSFDGVHPREALVQTLLTRSHGKLHVNDATNIAFLIETARKDPATLEMVGTMKTVQRETIAALVAETSDEQLMRQLHVALEEIKMLDILFKDPVKAVEEMDKEGLIDHKMLRHYRKNPALLEEETSKSMYFTFITLSVAAGFL
jgi:hypothetical protein